MLEPGICIGSVRQRSDLQQKNHHKPGDENAADLPQNKFQVRPSCQPPPSGDMRAIPARMVLGVSGGLLCVAHVVCLVSQDPLSFIFRWLLFSTRASIIILTSRLLLSVCTDGLTRRWS